MNVSAGKRLGISMKAPSRTVISHVFPKRGGFPLKKQVDKINDFAMGQKRVFKKKKTVGNKKEYLNTF